VTNSEKYDFHEDNFKVQAKEQKSLEKFKEKKKMKFKIIEARNVDFD